ncbi:MAG TPA: hypothetical protein VGK90_05310 [Rhizomicrobium sp.]|jgi:hypothetical protein
MSSWFKNLVIATAMVGLASSAQAHMGGMTGGRVAGGFHGFHGFHGRSWFLGRRQPGLVIAFPRNRFGRTPVAGWGGGAYSADVAAFDADDGDFAADDLHFRVQDSFGPGDIDREPPPAPVGDSPYGYARQDPWHGYDPDE